MENGSSARLVSDVALPSYYTDWHSMERLPPIASDVSPFKPSGDRMQIIDFGPRRGNHSTVVTAILVNIPQMTAQLVFNHLLVETRQVQSSDGLTTLVAQAPLLSQTGVAGPTIPVSLCVWHLGTVTALWPLADFTYVSDLTYPDTGSQQHLTYDWPCGFSPFYQSPRPHDPERFVSCPSIWHDDTSCSDERIRRSSMDPTTSPETSLSAFPCADDPVRSREEWTTAAAAAAVTLTENDSALTGVLAPCFHEHRAYTDSLLTRHEIKRKPRSSAGKDSWVCKKRTSIASGCAYPYRAPFPPTSSSPSSSSSSPSSTPTTLDIVGCLEDMMEHWTQDECKHQRRLVEFWCESSTQHRIQCAFQSLPYTSDNFQLRQGQLVVSCIYWPEQHDAFYITSVDCIRLLERLMHVRFSVEDKNRVRRNLEGFHPLTVSKCKASTTGFFKLIMSFPAPKPRHIEKDVKVFPWKSLPFALKKIVAKYSEPRSRTYTPTYHPTMASLDTAYTNEPIDSSSSSSTLSSPSNLHILNGSPHAQQ